MELAPALASIVLGVAIAAPVGPVNLVCLRRTLATGWRLGLASGIGAAFADGAFAAAAASGIRLLPAVISAHLEELRLVGGLGLVAIGAATALSPAPNPSLTPGVSCGVRGRLASAFVSTFLLTLRIRLHSSLSAPRVSHSSSAGCTPRPPHRWWVSSPARRYGGLSSRARSRGRAGGWQCGGFAS